jgi:hypothetical protein
LWPPQRGVGLQEPNLGKTNLRVSLAYSFGICFAPSLTDSFPISNANPACSCVYICKFQFRPIHPPSRRLSDTSPTLPPAEAGRKSPVAPSPGADVPAPRSRGGAASLGDRLASH